MGWLITVGILVLLSIIPLGVSVTYDEDSAVIRIIGGPLKYKVFPAWKKEKKRKECLI